MSRVAPDIERLMWLVAEQRDARAIAEFEERYPHLKAELAHRLKMVEGLKKAGGKAHRAAPAPQFRPRHTPPPSRPVLGWALGAAALAVLAVGSYYATLSLNKPEPLVQPEVSQPLGTEPKTPPTTENTQPRVETNSVPPVTTPDPDRVPPISEEQNQRKLVSINMKQTPLSLVLQAVAAEAGMTAELAPGMPDPDIDAQYQEQDPIEIMKDLGRQHGFTPFDQGNGTVLIIPAVEQPRDPGRSLTP